MAATSYPPQTVLHVDDDSDVLDLGETLLEHACPGLTVLRYEDPDEALAALSTTHVDCLVSDSISLADGTPFVRGVRARGETTPIVLFTGSEWHTVREVAEAVDAVGYVRKGNADALAELTRRVEAAVCGDLVESPRTVADGWTVVGWYDWTADGELSTRIAEAVSAHTGVAIETLPPLFDAIDADALTTVLFPVDVAAGVRRPRATAVDVQFRWADNDLLVTNEGLIALRPHAG